MSALAAALAAFQADLPAVHKGKTANVRTKDGGAYKYTYADLADVAKEGMPRLAAHGLAVSCRPHRLEDGSYELEGVLLHVSGEKLTGTLPVYGRSPQELGSSLTYARRYLLGCLTGIVTDDDDDAAGMAQPAERTRRQRGQPEPEQAGEPKPTTRTMSRRKPPEPAPEPAPGPDPGPDEPTSPGQPTDRAMRALHAAYRDAGMADRSDRLTHASQVLARQVSSSRDLTAMEVSQLLDALRPLAVPGHAAQEAPEEEPRP